MIDEGRGSLVEWVELGGGDVLAGFTTRSAGNLSHRRPHLPSALARSREAVAGEFGLEVSDLHLMRQVHGADVGTVTADVTPGAELADVDALVTAEPGRALCVQIADCVPVLLATSGGAIGAVHAGRRGLVAGVIGSALERIAELDRGGRVSAVVGPAIGGCCYEVPEALRDEVADAHPTASATTTWGTPALDLPGAVRDVLDRAGVDVHHADLGCTRCDERGRWFSHRADAAAGRQLGIVVREGGGG